MRNGNERDYQKPCKHEFAMVEYSAGNMYNETFLVVKCMQPFEKYLL